MLLSYHEWEYPSPLKLVPAEQHFACLPLMSEFLYRIHHYFAAGLDFAVHEASWNLMACLALEKFVEQGSRMLKAWMAEEIRTAMLMTRSLIEEELVAASVWERSRRKLR